MTSFAYRLVGAVEWRLIYRLRRLTSRVRRWNDVRRWVQGGLVVSPEMSVPPPGSRITALTKISRNVAMAGPITVKGAARVQPAARFEVGPYTAIGDELIVVCDAHHLGGPNIDKGLHRRFGFSEIGRSKDVTIGPGCWIGDRVTVLPGADVGPGAVLAAGAVVRGRVDPYTIVGGVPGRVVKRRCEPDVAAVLVSSGWWDWPDDRIRRNRAFFECDISALGADEVRALIQP